MSGVVPPPGQAPHQRISASAETHPTLLRRSAARSSAALSTLIVEGAVDPLAKHPTQALGGAQGLRGVLR